MFTSVLRFFGLGGKYDHPTPKPLAFFIDSVPYDPVPVKQIEEAQRDSTALPASFTKPDLFGEKKQNPTPRKKPLKKQKPRSPKIT